MESINPEQKFVLNYQIFWIQKFQNLSNIFDIKGGRGRMKIHMVSKGGLSKLHICPNRGEGGQKYPKIHPHGLWMFPYVSHKGPNHVEVN